MSSFIFEIHKRIKSKKIQFINYFYSVSSFMIYVCSFLWEDRMGAGEERADITAANALCWGWIEYIELDSLSSGEQGGKSQPAC